MKTRKQPRIAHNTAHGGCAEVVPVRGITVDAEYINALEVMVVEPLRRIIGKSLQSVIYYVLHADSSCFDVDAANMSGGSQGVHLTFENDMVELDWDWQRAFRPYLEDRISSAIAYHLVVRSASERQAYVSVPNKDDDTGLGAIDATAVFPWNAIQGEALSSFEVWGVPLADARISPQAVAFCFPSAEIIVSIGMTHPLSIGDGDEMLIFTGQEWIQNMAEPPQGWLVPLRRLSVEHLSNPGKQQEEAES